MFKAQKRVGTQKAVGKRNQHSDEFKLLASEKQDKVEICHISKSPSTTGAKYTTGQDSPSGTDETPETSQDSPSATREKYTTGLAFSGGGIRSAAICSGVLRRILERGVEPDYLSCVSGGGYTGTAYLDWKHRHGLKDDPTWHKQFFEHMRSRTGIFCDWQRPWECCPEMRLCKGICDTIVLVLLLVVVFIVSIVGWGSFACPLALFIDLTIGKYLRADRFQCNEKIEQECDFPIGSLAYKRMVIFAVTSLFFIIFHIVFTSMGSAKVKVLSHYLSKFSGFLFAFTFLPWFIHDYLSHTPLIVEVGVAVINAAMWFLLPGLRRHSSRAITVYLFSYVIYWRVYDEQILGYKHTETRFFWCLFASVLVWILESIIGIRYLRLVHMYFRWRLQKAFYYRKNVEICCSCACAKYCCSCCACAKCCSCCACTGIGWYDFFPGSHFCCCNPSEESNQATSKERNGHANANALTLADLKGIKPQYISNILVSGWQECESEQKHSLLTMTPTEIERIQLCEQMPKMEKKSNQPMPDKHNNPSASFKVELLPKDIKLSAAMAMSAAALSPHQSAYEQTKDSIMNKHVLTILGLEMGASIVNDLAYERREPKLYKVLLYLIKGVLLLPIIIPAILYWVGYGLVPFYIGVGVSVLPVVLLGLFEIVETKNVKMAGIQKFVRWLVVHVPSCRFVRDIFDFVNKGPVPPAMLHLSDFGDVENLAILPLLKRRLQRIVVVDGGYTKTDSSYGDDLIHAMELARKKLNCCFLSENGSDVLRDIKEKFVHKAPKQQPRSYRFKVHYYEKENNNVGDNEVGEGEVILIAPRHPDKGIQKTDRVIQEEDWRNIVGSGKWGPGPDLEAAEVDRLMGCCCECCHCSCPSKCCRGDFPQHKTANQFFTPAMFSAYHREGYRACVEADADNFLNGGAQEVEMSNNIDEIVA